MLGLRRACESCLVHRAVAAAPALAVRACAQQASGGASGGPSPKSARASAWVREVRAKGRERLRPALVVLGGVMVVVLSGASHRHEQRKTEAKAMAEERAEVERQLDVDRQHRVAKLERVLEDNKRSVQDFAATQEAVVQRFRLLSATQGAEQPQQPQQPPQQPQPQPPAAPAPQKQDADNKAAGGEEGGGGGKAKAKGGALW